MTDRPERRPDLLVDPFEISGDPELAGLTLPLEEIWNPI